MAKKAGMATGVEVARISVKVSPDTKSFRRDLKSDLEEIERSVKAKIDVEPNMGNFRQEVAAKTKGMRTSVKVDADVDKNFFGRVMDKLGGIEPPSFGSGINPAGYAVIAAAVVPLIPLVAGLLGTVTAAVTALPGLLTAVAAPIAAITLGLDGIKKAAEVLKAPFDGLKATMSAVNEKAFTPVFETLGKVFPSIEKTLPGVTSGLAKMAQSFADTLTHPGGVQLIERSITKIADALSTAAPGVGQFTAGLLKLVEGLTGNLPGVAKWFNETAASFGRWVTDFTQAGPDGTSKFDKALGNLGDTLKIVGGGLVDIAGKSLDFFSDPEKVKSFKVVLEGIVSTISAIVTGVNAIATAFSSLPLAADGKFQWLDALPLQFQIVRDLVNALPGAVSAAWSGIQAAASAAWSSITSTASTVWSSVTGVVQGAVSAISGAVSNIGSAISGVWNGIVGAAQSAWSSIVSTVQGAVGNVVGAVTGMVGNIIGALANLAAEGAAAGRNLAQGLINGIGGMIGSVVAKAKELASSAAGAVKDFLGIHSPSKLFTDFGEFTGQGLVNGLESQLGAVQKTAQKMASTVSDEFDGIGFGADGLTYGGNDPLLKAAAGLGNVPMDFAASTGKQFASDLGISGNGIISKALTEGTKYIFQIGSVDEAMDIKAREERKSNLTVSGRQ